MMPGLLNERMRRQLLATDAVRFVGDAVAVVVTEQPYDQAELQHAWEQQPDWLNLGPSYVHALAYTYETLGGYLRLRTDRDFVMILLGDHQPPAVVSGEGASWEVPVHVIASRRDVLDSLVAQGFQPGLFPHHPATSKMHALLPVLLTAFSRPSAKDSRDSSSSAAVL